MAVVTPARRGFVFSLDAFISLVVILLAVYTLFHLVATPKPYYSSFEQARDLASDSLRALDSSPYPNSNHSSRLGYVLFQNPSMIPSQFDPLIPEQFGYALDYYNMTSGQWVALYSTASDASSTHNREYQKLAASASLVTMGYARDPDVRDPANWYGYISCGGNATMCIPDARAITTPGSPRVGVARLTVFI